MPEHLLLFISRLHISSESNIYKASSIHTTQKIIQTIRKPTMHNKNPHYSHSHAHAQQIPMLEYCSICCTEKPRHSHGLDNLRIKQICYECWHSHIKNYITRISYRTGDDVMSPFNQGTPISIVDCINSLTEGDGGEIQEMLFRKYSAFTKDIEKCPSEACDFVYIGEKCKWASSENVYNCPKCEMPLTADKAFTLKSMMASLYLIMANKCPKCDIPIQKISGCPHMTCPCGHHFCWYCYKDHPSGTLKRVYHLHSIPECAFIFISKIILFIICSINLLITFNGNGIVKSIFSILAIIFSVLWRAAALDGFILIQVMFWMMQRRRRFPRSSMTLRSIVAFYLVVNFVGIGLLYWFEELVFFGEIFVGELALAGLGFVIGYSVIYSIETWFEFIA